ncbi:MAG: hypothetical protein O3A50_03815 [Planctomycetota bacterium]|nr:hypothetical protein [Planctomycetota bacterium]
MLEMAATGEGKLLRLSARRSVFMLADEGHNWILKLDAPERSFEAIRACLRRPPLARESRNWQLLSERWPALQELLGYTIAEQLDSARGCFARQWFDGRRGEAWQAVDAEAVGAGIAALHQLGWTDADLSPNDMLLTASGLLLPLDLGHAHVGTAPSSATDRSRDWVHFLGGFTLRRRLMFAKPMLEAYRKELRLRENNEELLRLALLWAGTILHRQSRRCLRKTRDFQPQKNGIVRSEGVPQGELLTLAGDVSSDPREIFRLLYELELHDIAAMRPVRLEIVGPEDWVIEGVIPERSTTLQADLLAAGYVSEESLNGFVHDPRFLKQVKPQN